MLLQRKVLSLTRNPLLASVRHAILTDAGYWVCTRHTVRAALQACRGEAFDAVVVCHTLSRRDVDTLLDELARSGSEVPVLLLSELYEPRPEIPPPTMLHALARIAPARPCADPQAA